MLGQRLPAPLQNRFDGLPLREPRALVKLRRKADLIVDVSLPGEYSSHIPCHANNAFFRLHQLQGKLEARQICVHVCAVRGPRQPAPEII